MFSTPLANCTVERNAASISQPIASESDPLNQDLGQDWTGLESNQIPTVLSS